MLSGTRSSMPTIKAAMQLRALRYIVVGVLVYILELVIIVVAQRLGATPVGAVAVSYVIGLVVSFILQKVVTFGDRRIHHKVILPQIVAVALLVLCNFGFTLLLTKLLQDILPAVITRTIALALTTVWNFYLYKTKIFKQSHNQKSVLID